MEKDFKMKLGDIFITSSGGTPSRKNRSFFNGSNLWVKSGELRDKIIYDSEERISDKAILNSSAKIFPKNTLLIALYGANIGKLGILGKPATTNQAVCGILRNEDINLRFLFYYLLQKRVDLIQLGVGGAQPNISQSILKEQIIPIFPPIEQHQIVQRIEELFTELDKSIESLMMIKKKCQVSK